MALSFADALSQLTAATGLDADSLLHIGDTEEDVATNLALLLDDPPAAAVASIAGSLLARGFRQARLRTAIWSGRIASSDCSYPWRTNLSALMQRASAPDGRSWPGSLSFRNLVLQGQFFDNVAVCKA